MKEAEIRDILAENISILEKGLTLQKKEQYIPNNIGTRGFIDLYARDENGNHVLIELKRSKPATRETLNEIIKYVEGVKAHFGSRDDEIRVIVASTEWEELLVPYSRYISDTSISVVGLRLNIDKMAKSISVDLIEPLEVNHGRFIAPWYDVFWYKDSNSYTKGIETIKKSCIEKNITDYITASFKLKKQIPSIPANKRHRALEAIFGPMKETEQELFSNVVFFAHQIKTINQYLAILESDTEIYEEATYLIGDMDDEEKICLLHEQLSNLNPKPHCDDIEIGNPAKFNQYLNDENFELEKITKFGAFERNHLLTENILISELKGLNGSSGQQIQRTISLSNVSQVSLLKKEIEEVLENNPIWSERVIRNIEDICKEFQDEELELNLYNPSTGIFTIYFALSKEESHQFLPNYYMKVSSKEKERIYFGCLDTYGTPLNFYEIIDKYYSGNIGMLVHSITWGAFESRDLDILEDLGLTYRNYRCDINSKKRKYFSFKDGRWRDCNAINPYEWLENYIKNNEELINDLMSELAIRDNDLYFESNASNELSITITKHEIEERNITKAMNKLSLLMMSAKVAQKMKRKVEISFDGYSQDPRHLYDIEEVREYVKVLAREFPYLFYFISLDSFYEPLKVIAACHIISDEMCHEDSSRPYGLFLEQQFVGLNELTDWLGLSLEENKEISYEVMNYLSSDN